MNRTLALASVIALACGALAIPSKCHACGGCLFHGHRHHAYSAPGYSAYSGYAGYAAPAPMSYSAYAAVPMANVATVPTVPVQTVYSAPAAYSAYAAPYAPVSLMAPAYQATAPAAPQAAPQAQYGAQDYSALAVVGVLERLLTVCERLNANRPCAKSGGNGTTSGGGGGVTPQFPEFAPGDPPPSPPPMGQGDVAPHDAAAQKGAQATMAHLAQAQSDLELIRQRRQQMRTALGQGGASAQGRRIAATQP